MRRNSKWRHLLLNQRPGAYENVVRGSKYTGTVYLRRLGRYCYEHRLTPQQRAATDREAPNNLILDTMTVMESSGLAGSYIHAVIKAIKTWLTFNGREVTVPVKITGV